jgi:hypothetical protein
MATNIVELVNYSVSMLQHYFVVYYRKQLTRLKTGNGGTNYSYTILATSRLVELEEVAGAHEVVVSWGVMLDEVVAQIVGSAPPVDEEVTLMDRSGL